MGDFIYGIKRKLCKTICGNRSFVNSINVVEAKDMLRFDSNIVLLDVRSILEHNEKNIPGSIVIPSYELYKKAEIMLMDKLQPIIVYCKNGVRSAKAVEILEELGYKNVYSLEGGIEEWF